MRVNPPWSILWMHTYCKCRPRHVQTHEELLRILQTPAVILYRFSVAINSPPSHAQVLRMISRISLMYLGVLRLHCAYLLESRISIDRPLDSTTKITGLSPAHLVKCHNTKVTSLMQFWCTDVHFCFFILCASESVLGQHLGFAVAQCQSRVFLMLSLQHNRVGVGCVWWSAAHNWVLICYYFHHLYSESTVLVQQHSVFGVIKIFL